MKLGIVQLEKLPKVKEKYGQQWFCYKVSNNTLQPLADFNKLVTFPFILRLPTYSCLTARARKHQPLPRQVLQSDFLLWIDKFNSICGLMYSILSFLHLHVHLTTIFIITILRRNRKKIWKQWHSNQKSSLEYLYLVNPVVDLHKVFVYSSHLAYKRQSHCLTQGAEITTLWHFGWYFASSARWQDFCNQLGQCCRDFCRHLKPDYALWISPTHLSIQFLVSK